MYHNTEVTIRYVSWYRLHWLEWYNSKTHVCLFITWTRQCYSRCHVVIHMRSILHRCIEKKYCVSCTLPLCSLLYRGEGQVKYCWASLPVLSFHSFLKAAPSLHLLSSPDLLMSLLMQSSHLSCGLPLFLRPWCFSTSALFASLLASILTKWPAHLILLLNNLPVRLHCISTSFLRSFILLLFTLFVLVNRWIQCFHTLAASVVVVLSTPLSPDHTSMLV